MTLLEKPIVLEVVSQMSNAGESYLYHGSQLLVETLIPRPSRGVGPEKDQLCAVYASHTPNFAIAFALPIRGAREHTYSWTMSIEDENGEFIPSITIQSGYLDLSRRGYLYRVSPKIFEAVDEFQWISFSPVVPVDYIAIDPNDYVSWIVEGDIR